MNEEKEIKKLIKSKNVVALKNYFSILYTKYYKLVCFAISKYVKQKEDIEDLADETFLNVFNNIQSIDTSFKYYVIRTANNIAINFVKRKQFSVNQDEEDIPSNEDTSSSLCYDELISKLKTCLKPIEVEVITKHVLEGYTFKDLAKELGFKEKKVSSMYLYAIKKFLIAEGEDYE